MMSDLTFSRNVRDIFDKNNTRRLYMHNEQVRSVLTKKYKPVTYDVGSNDQIVYLD